MYQSRQNKNKYIIVFIRSKYYNKKYSNTLKAFNTVLIASELYILIFIHLKKEVHGKKKQKRVQVVWKRRTNE